MMEMIVLSELEVLAEVVALEARLQFIVIQMEVLVV